MVTFRKDFFFFYSKPECFFVQKIMTNFCFVFLGQSQTIPFITPLRGLACFFLMGVYALSAGKEKRADSFMSFPLKKEFVVV